MTQSILHATVALLAVINPMVCAAMIAKREGSKSTSAALMAAFKAMFVVLLILEISAFGGHSVLKAFGISMDAFQVVGGIILAFIGFRMLVGGQSSDDGGEEDSSLMPVVLFAASPGTITMVITLAAANDTGAWPVSTALGVVTAILISMVMIAGVLVLAGKKQGAGSAVVSTYMGLIIAAMGLQFMLVGTRHFYAG